MKLKKDYSPEEEASCPLLGWAGRMDVFLQALGARPQSLRHPLPYAGCGICATHIPFSSLASRDSEGAFVWEDGFFALRKEVHCGASSLASTRGPNLPESRP